MTPRTHRLPRILLVALAALALPAAAFAATLDEGFYRVYQNNLLLGLEQISFQQRNDSTVVTSTIDQLLPRPYQAPDTLQKKAALVLAIADGSLRGYMSSQMLNSDLLGRGLSMADTTYTSYREDGRGGFGDTYVRPPGRTYVIDPQVFSLFDVLLRDMQKQSFDERTVTLLYLTERDTVVDGRVKRLGKESIKLGTQTLTAEKFSVRDPWSEFTVWMSLKGRMLRLTQAQVRLRVDRAPESLAPGYRNVSATAKAVKKSATKTSAAAPKKPPAPPPPGR